jgi:hypothetical protein
LGAISTTIGNSPLFALNQIGVTQSFVNPDFVIGLDSWALNTATINSTLTLTADATNPPVGGLPTPLPAFPPLTFSVPFAETPNDNVTCANLPPPPGSGPPFTGGPPAPNPCPDIFVIVGGINAFPFFYDALTGVVSPFPAGPDFVEYIVQIFPINGANDPTLLSTLSDQECAQAGAPSGCQGFITAEDATTTQPFGFAITTQPVGVPEPGTLAMLAIGLTGLGFTLRRRSG